MQNNYRTYLGAADWRHPHWIGAFYPDDMPEDWQFAYYQTQYHCVWLDRSTWRGLTTAWRDLMNDARDDFRFLLEGSGEDINRTQPSLRNDIRVIADEDARIIRFDMHTSLETLAQEIQKSHECDATYLVSRDAQLDKLQQVAALLELLGM